MTRGGAAIILLLVLNLVSGVLVKHSARFHGDAAMLAAIAAALAIVYAGRAGLWLTIGKRYQLSWVYPLLGANYVLALLVGRVVFGEEVPLQRAVGALLVVAGVTLTSSSRERYDRGRAVVSPWGADR